MVPEGRGVFARMTITENLLMGAFTRNDKAGIQRDIEHMFEVFPRLKERADQLAGTMSGGEQQMCAIGRALMSGPKLLLLDEPSAGLAPVVVQQIFDVVRRMSAEGYTVLIVEQNIQQVLKVVDRAYLLETGKIRRSGNAADLLASDELRRAYLGV
jgi:branched-chain amino acid transport system ATP-binding protein